jgi:hypothetical protein
MLLSMTTQSTRQATATSTTKTYEGGCHCGAVRFRATLDLSAGIGKCNCSICTKQNFLGAKVKPEDFTLLAGESALTDYQFNTKVVHHLFCKHCGVRPYGHANIPQAGGEFYSVNVHCLEAANLDRVPVRYSDGLHNKWWGEAPAFP